jgi:hypothetical protein
MNTTVFSTYENFEMEKESKRPPSFKISVPGDANRKNSVLEKLQQIRNIIVQQLNHPVNNADILEKVFDKFISIHNEENLQQNMSNIDLNTFLQANKKDVDQQLFVTAESSLKRLVRVVENHAVFCSGHFNVHRNTQKGHVAVFRFSCDVDKHHSVLWS